MTHGEFVYGMNAGFAQYTAENSLKSLTGKKIDPIVQEREKLATILIDVINDHSDSEENMLDEVDYYNASHKLNVILGTAYSYDFIT